MLSITFTLGISTLFFALAALVFFVWTRSLSSASRRYGYAVTAAAGGMTIAYALMSLVHIQYGGNTNLIRFLGYTVMWLPVIYLVCAVAGVGRQLVLTLTAVVLGRVWVTLSGWYLEGILGTVATLVPFVLVAAGIYLLFGPFTRIAETQPPQRALLFNKLKYLIVLAWVGLVACGLISADALGLTDDLVGQIVVVYVEAILVVGFGGIVLRSTEALEETAESTGLLSFDSVETLERVEQTDSELAD